MTQRRSANSAWTKQSTLLRASEHDTRRPKRLWTHSRASKSARTRPWRPRGVPTPVRSRRSKPRFKPRVDPEALTDVGVPPQARPSQTARLVETGVGSLEAFAALANRRRPRGRRMRRRLAYTASRAACLPRQRRRLRPAPTHSCAAPSPRCCRTPLSATTSATPPPAGSTASTGSPAVTNVSTMVVVSPKLASCTVMPTTAPVSRSTACSGLWARCAGRTSLSRPPRGSVGCFQSSLGPSFSRFRSKRASSGAGRRRNAGGRGKTAQERVVALARVSADDTPQ